MIRFAARAAALLALIGAWGFSAGDRLAAPFLSEARAEPSSPAADETPDLASLKVFNRVVLQVKENYFDPSRIQPKQMLIDSLDAVEKQVPEVMVDGDVDSGELKVNVGGKSATFSIADVDSIFKMSLRLGQIMGFVQKNLDKGHTADELRNVEYALVNGMLSSLDPHSVLLKPEYFKEMKLSTKGEFGGLGFIIAMKDGELTVVKVLKGTKENPTPASKYGIKPKDKILQIAGESTVNMDVTEAAERLRGKPGSKIKVLLQRKGWAEPKLMELPRARIEIESVVSKLLTNKIGYVRLKGFQGNTSRDLQAAIRDLKTEAGGKLAGLVIDLRGNPGGLLEQAIQVSDTFVDSGTIVTTVGMSNKLREVKKATDQGNPDLEKNLPLAVLVNGGSASASEIVAGALKNLDRAVIVGRTSFGKGSVQVLYDFPDQSALKLTIAQYLTPGDVSIQETGITPDVELVASRVDKDAVSAFAPIRTMREQDLDRHLSNPADLFAKEPTERPEAKKNDPDQKPLYSLRYLRDEPKTKDGEAALDDEDAEEEELSDDFVEDYQVRFARDLLGAAPFGTRSQILAKMTPFVNGRSAEEEGRIDKAIANLGVDWTKAPAAAGAKAPKVVATLQPAPSSVSHAGDKLDLVLSVTNQGDAPIHRLRAWTESEGNPLLDRREFLIGSVGPGQTKRWTATVELPKALASRRDAVVVKLQDADGHAFDDVRSEINVAELAKPRFAYGWQVVERSGSGDGRSRPGQKLSLVVDVKNVGAGVSSETTYASIKNKGNEKIFIEKGRQKLGELAPGATARATFELELKAGYAEPTMPVQLLVFDEKLEEIVVEKLEIPVTSDPLLVQAAKGFVRPQQDKEIVVRAAPLDDALVLATAGKGASLPVDGRLEGWARVEWQKGRIGFVKLGSDQKVVDGGKPSFANVGLALGRVPPEIRLDVDTSTGGIAVDGTRYTLSGTVLDPQLRDVYVFVNDKKVFFAPGAKDGSPLRIKAEFPLKEGANHVVVVARDGSEVASRQAISVLRRKAADAPASVEPKAAAAIPAPTPHP
ncbi:MXAN_5808 family serine peptidase [Vulgatibacter incomptus]|uniref:Carboxyl-terminal protease n=1 Tax=Vulgatibacter incomptus TaxID=1391653 RepID=A0A0K1PAQ6_9BACT|nr:MXAN_5808 family serine peptidase [Vulgatibacter incomptus]AKU90199.1 Carboxyl-terminal protease [Vulgatibacter incomptus]